MKKLILTMCLTAAGVFGAAAQMRLTLGEALDLALSENPTVKVAEMEVQRFDYVKRQTWGSWIPQISVGGTYTRSIVKQSMTKGLSFGADNTLAAQGDALKKIYFGENAADYCGGMRAGSDLQPEVEALLAEMKAAGEMDALVLAHTFPATQEGA